MMVIINIPIDTDIKAIFQILVKVHNIRKAIMITKLNVSNIKNE